MPLPDVTPSRVGGDVAVDFLNTVGWRLDPSRRHETLPSYLHLLAWVKQSALVSSAEVEPLTRQANEQPELAAAEHALVVEMREDTYNALNEDGHPGVLQHLLLSAHANSQLHRESDGAWRWTPTTLDLATPRHRLALEFARLLTSDSVARFHRCEDQHCGWVFLDASRQHNRRWCSSADCGNRNRVRAHYVRSKGSSPADSR
ncbi:CGNR zinc finger domain-containing protein [Phytohabitans kaempferiae]|uniref:CGNR zinc finger domain-containing protein n=1 Tax=Phytohabitans kaempferiae TaxID=1620943 RepID=A0ABV6M431_9ACTN